MHRAVVLTSLVLLLLAVAGVSAAQESGIFADEASSDDPPGSITQEKTSFEASVAEDTMAGTLPDASSEPKHSENISEATVVTEPTVGETEVHSGVGPDQKTLTPGSNNVGKLANSGRGIGKPEQAGKAPNTGKPHDIEHLANGKPEERTNEVEQERGESQRKVTLCHKKKKTLTVGAPALAAHLSHGDYQGACQTKGARSDLSGETMKPEAANNSAEGGSEGHAKVILCHKKKNTLTVGFPARAAHLRHGDSLGAC